MTKLESLSKFMSHPMTIGAFCMIMAWTHHPDSIAHLQWYIAMCSFMAAGLVRK